MYTLPPAPTARKRQSQRDRGFSFSSPRENKKGPLHTTLLIFPARTVLILFFETGETEVLKFGERDSGSPFLSNTF